MDEQLRQATLGATSAQAPASPLGSFPELSKLYESSFQGLQSAAPTAARLNMASESVSRAKAKKANYQKVKRDDGGFGFYDGEGNEMSAADYAAATGKSPVDVLADSENPIDIGYLNDYKNLREFLTAVQNNDKEAKNSVIAQRPELKEYENNFQGLMEKFRQHYPTVYGRTGSGNQPVNSSYIPRASAGDEEDPASPGGGRVGD